MTTYLSVVQGSSDYYAVVEALPEVAESVVVGQVSQLWSILFLLLSTVSSCTCRKWRMKMSEW